MHPATRDGADTPVVLVTGAAGKIGRYVTKRLCEQGFAVRGLTTKSVSPQPGSDGIEWRSIDFTQSLDVTSHVAGCTAIVHLAAEIVEPSRMQQVNVEATAALATAAAAAGVTTFCYVSSASVYGSSRARIVTEASPTVDPTREVKGEHWAPPAVRAYARSKLLGEKRVAEVVESSMKAIIVRPTVVVDVDDMLKLRRRSKSRQFMVGRRHAHHVYVADVADAIVWLLRRCLTDPAGAEPIAIYNIADDDVGCAAYADITKRLHRLNGGVVLAMPAVLDWILEYWRFGALPWRHSLGRMIVSSDRLSQAGFLRSCGVERLYDRIAGSSPSSVGSTTSCARS